MNVWGAARFLKVGPDGLLAWDQLPEIGIYRGHVKDGLTPTSHAGATCHAYGVKVAADSYGMDLKKPLRALSGYPGSIMQEALARGKAVGLVNSGHIGEPGTGVFLASVRKRKNVDAIASQILQSGAQVLLLGGEKFFLPEGVEGFHGPGARSDQRNLIEEARAAGYTIVFNRSQLQALDLPTVDKLLGIFATSDTYHAKSEELQAAEGLDHYEPEAPTVAEMTEAALTILSRHEKGFLLVTEEEGTDNFSNHNNAGGTMEAALRADDALQIGLDFLQAHPDTLLLTCSDSDAGGLQIVSIAESLARGYGGLPNLLALDQLPMATTDNGAPMDGIDGPQTAPFLSLPDRAGRRFPFGIAWAGKMDFSGGIAARAAGLHAERLPLNFDNTDTYRMLYLALFGEWLPHAE